jgi:plasmid stability protein
MSDFRIDGISDKTMQRLRARARKHGWPAAEEARYILTLSVGKKPAAPPLKRTAKSK